MRIEEDFIGKVEVPDEAYYGSFTVRASNHFKLSGMLVNKELIYAVALIKKCAALVNGSLGALDNADVIAKAADEVMAGKLDDQFILDAFQAGAGTPLHMNVNEVIANRADEMLGGKKGEYKLVHPNNQVNMSQSSNDVIPTATRLATIKLAAPLLEEGKKFHKILLAKAEENKSVMKIGRTHLQDAVPMTYGQTFAAWARAVEKDLEQIEKALESVCELGIGGTATGSGINTHPDFRGELVKHLNKEGKFVIELKPAKDTVETTQSHNDFTTLSAALRRYAVTMGRIADDLRLLVSGPKAGIAEIILPEVEPGSSIMPGKINPSVPEAVNMVCYQVVANDLAVVLGAQSSQLELNFCAPLIAQNLLQSETLLTNCTALFGECIENTQVAVERSRENLERTFGYATALNPYIGYKEVSNLVREALKEGKTLREVVVGSIMSEADFDKVVATATGPAQVDKEILGRMKKG